jgi:thiol-disulfide isomerase/thioredoxin
MTKIKQLIPASLGVMAMAFTLVSCDDIDEKDRYLSVELPAPSKVVLIQEFTGQYCSNCPTGAQTVHSIQEAYPESVVAVNFHPENTQYTQQIGDIKLTCPEATAYYEYYHPDGFPAAIIDGTSFSGSLIQKNIAKWSGFVTEALEVEAPASVSLIANYDAATRALTADWSVLYTNDYAGRCSLLVWVIENGIVGSQLSGKTIIRDYEHNHVLRGAVNGTWGEEIGENFTAGHTFSGSATRVLDESWKVENCQLVGVLFATSTKQILQTTIIDLPTVLSE